jgi:sodium/bile acid cotransporter 7
VPVQGNVGLAVFLTVATNILGIALVPLWLKAMLNTPGSPVLNSSSNSPHDSAATGQLQSSIRVNVAEMFIKLLLSNLAPTVLGKLLRDRSAAVCGWVGRRATALALATSTCLSLISWLSLSSAREPIVRTEIGAMLLVLVGGCINPAQRHL